MLAAGPVRPGGSIQADQTEHPACWTQSLPAFTPVTGVEQWFVAEADGLSQVWVRFGTYQVGDAAARSWSGSSPMTASRWRRR